MTGTIFNGLRTQLLNNVLDSNGNPIFKTVELWNNQVEHELSEDNDEKPRLLPACYIEFGNIERTQLQGKYVTQANFDTTLHIVYGSMKDNDVSYLDVKQSTYKYVQGWEVGTCSRFLCINEQGNYDFPNLRYYMQTYHATLKDFDAVPTANTGTVTTLTITPQIVDHL